MDFREYQESTKKTAIYPNQGNNLVYVTLGLNGEAGEVAEQVKKAIRDDNGQIMPGRAKALTKEIGDVLWYVSQICNELGLSMESVAEGNIRKLLDRQERGKLPGSGDNR